MLLVREPLNVITTQLDKNKLWLQNGNGAVVNHAAHNTAKNKVLNLTDRRP